MLKLAVVYVKYDDKKHLQAWSRLCALLDSIPCIQKSIIIVNNAITHDSVHMLGPRVYEISGDNSSREFSGWQRGYTFLLERNIPFHGVFFTNEAFENSGDCFLSGLRGGLFVLIACFLHRLVGKTDAQNTGHPELSPRIRGCFINNKEVSFWVCTAGFIVSKKMLRSLGSLVTVTAKDMARFLDVSPPQKSIANHLKGRYFKEDAPLSPQQAFFLEHWLTKMWHSAFDPRTNWSLFCIKTQAILNEHLLTAKVLSLGYKVFSVNNFIKKSGSE